MYHKYEIHVKGCMICQVAACSVESFLFAPSWPSQLVCRLVTTGHGTTFLLYPDFWAQIGFISRIWRHTAKCMGKINVSEVDILGICDASSNRWWTGDVGRMLKCFPGRIRSAFLQQNLNGLPNFRSMSKDRRTRFATSKPIWETSGGWCCIFRSWPASMRKLLGKLEHQTDPLYHGVSTSSGFLNGISMCGNIGKSGAPSLLGWSFGRLTLLLVVVWLFVCLLFCWLLPSIFKVGCWRCPGSLGR